MAIDDNYPDGLNLLFNAKAENADQIRMFFQFAGYSSESKYQTIMMERVIHTLQADIQPLRAQVESNERRIIRLELHFNNLFTARLQKYFGGLFPEGSRRRIFLNKILRKQRS